MNNLKTQIKNLPDTPGVYIFKSKDLSIIYIGKSIRIKTRVSSYFNTSHNSAKTRELISRIIHISFIKTESEFEALLLEAKLIKLYQPIYNVISKDDKNKLYITISSDEFPVVSTARKEFTKYGISYGPFQTARTTFDLLKTIRTIFPYHNEKVLNKRACFYSHLHLCDPCPNIIRTLTGSDRVLKTKRYRSSIRKIKLVLSGKSKIVVKQLEKQMKTYAKNQEFEKATAVKNQLEKLWYLSQKKVSISQYLENPLFAEENKKKQLSELASLFHISNITRIEGYDISNTSGINPTASMVVFIDGFPTPKLYRRFNIKTKGPNDFAMISETLSRRLKHKEWEVPDLMIIDGGAGQLQKALIEIRKKKLNITTIGITKQYEHIIVPHSNHKTIFFKTISLPASSPARMLIQQVRDESHRFAKKYHMYLRKKTFIKH